mmetsp:Transcript_77512/g.230908  ORF Transcript_77512/g.230908 Transcript_77512/m.230908 type:complete len:300 (+) Transcript_77512:214-1113(+)
MPRSSSLCPLAHSELRPQGQEAAATWLMRGPVRQSLAVRIAAPGKVRQVVQHGGAEFARPAVQAAPEAHVCAVEAPPDQAAAGDDRQLLREAVEEDRSSSLGSRQGICHTPGGCLVPEVLAEVAERGVHAPDGRLGLRSVRVHSASPLARRPELPPQKHVQALGVRDVALRKHRVFQLYLSQAVLLRVAQQNRHAVEAAPPQHGLRRAAGPDGAHAAATGGAVAPPRVGGCLVTVHGLLLVTAVHYLLRTQRPHGGELVLRTLRPGAALTAHACTQLHTPVLRREAQPDVTTAPQLANV